MTFQKSGTLGQESKKVALRYGAVMSSVHREPPDRALPNSGHDGLYSE
jgi:hypothetical protein